ncbi:cell division cycle protein 48 [Ascosphaera apis ARSEF 7405]|uniref:Cell division cycle protein 48 n=1 Tax=Ascosphaera apis ARSEF 7405 TaxID=392613 RepID=A0A167XX11_9EURO|nr:cell division cycle protein 48 [Ascosphaera apis ARSEF 7405]
MSDGVRLAVQAFPRPARNDFKDAFRVHVSPGNLVLLKTRPGDLCRLRKVDDEAGETPLHCAIAWSSPDRIPDTVVQTSKMLQELYSLKPKEKIQIMKDPDGLSDVDTVYLKEVTADPAPIRDTDRRHWEWALRGPLENTEILTIGLPFDLPPLNGTRRKFKIIEIRSTRPHITTQTLFKFTSESKVSLGTPEVAPVSSYAPLYVQPDGLGGLSRQLEQINEWLKDYDGHQMNIKMPEFYKSSGGILIFGPKGTGKSSLLSAIKAAGWRKVLTFNTTSMNRQGVSGEEALRKMFAEALQIQPSIIAIDQLDFVAPKRSSTGGNETSVAPVLSELIDTIQGTNVLVVAAARNPNQVDDALRTPHRFGIEIELPVPTARERCEILRAIRGTGPRPTDDVLSLVAERTHGYVGADLFSLMQLACRKALSRYTQNTAVQVSSGEDFLDISEDDVLSAMQEIRPTAMREVFLETPNVKWSDIGGQHDVKLRLQRALREIFRKARSASPSIIFFDEIDAIASKRGGSGGTQGSSVNVLTTLLNEMDGIEELKNVLVVAATNKPEVLDSALMRPGRLDNIIYIGPPDPESRREIFSNWLRKSIVGDDVNIEELTALTEGYSGAEVVSICEHAADAALDEEFETGQAGVISRRHFETALRLVQRQISPSVIEGYLAWQMEMMRI